MRKMEELLALALKNYKEDDYVGQGIVQNDNSMVKIVSILILDLKIREHEFLY